MRLYLSVITVSLFIFNIPAHIHAMGKGPLKRSRKKAFDSDYTNENAFCTQLRSYQTFATFIPLSALNDLDCFDYDAYEKVRTTYIEACTSQFASNYTSENDSGPASKKVKLLGPHKPEDSIVYTFINALE